MKVIVLTAGRCGSTSLYHACREIRNFTAGHDTKDGELAAERVQTPDNHIEIDTRFAWFLGRLAELDDGAVHYVFLTRQSDKIAKSYDQRWASPKSIIRGYCEAILQRAKSNGHPELALDMVETIEANIRAFLVGRTHSQITLETWQDDMKAFFEDIGAEVSLEKAHAAFQKRHNPSRRPSLLVNMRLKLSLLADRAERLLKSRFRKAP